MLIRKNTKAFKTIVEIVVACQSMEDREKLIRLFITKAGDTIRERISIEGIQGESALFYEMTFQAVLNNLKSSNHQLHESDEMPGIYFFHSSSNKVWDETPFEFDEAVKKEFSSLPELPTVRKKEKAEKFVIPSPKVKTETPPLRKEKDVQKPKVKAEDKGTKQPDYKLKRKIHFTDLDKVLFRQPQLKKKDVLDYYNKIADFILPYLKDRPLQIQPDSINNKKHTVYKNIAELSKDFEERTNGLSLSKGKEQLLLCNDKDDLLQYVELGCIAFHVGHSRLKSTAFSDYIVIGVDSDAAFTKMIEVTLTVRDILTGLQLPSLVKTNGNSGLHVYIPLDAKSDFGTSEKAGEYLCKLVRLKLPDLARLKDSDASYGSVFLDYHANKQGVSVIAPYSFIPGQSALVATPLLWDEVKEELQAEQFNPESVLKRLRQVGDPFEPLFKKKVNAEALLKRLEENYAFLF